MIYLEELPGRVESESGIKFDEPLKVFIRFLLTNDDKCPDLWILLPVSLIC